VYNEDTFVHLRCLCYELHELIGTHLTLLVAVYRGYREKIFSLRQTGRPWRTISYEGSRAVVWSTDFGILQVKRDMPLKSTIFWDMTLCSTLKVNRRFGGTCRLNLQDRRLSRPRNHRESRWQLLGLFFNPEDWGYIFPRNVPWFSTDYIAQSVTDWLWVGRQRDPSSSPGRVKNFLFSMSSTPALGPTQPPIQWVPGVLSPGVKRPGREANHSPPTSAEVKKMRIYTFSPPYAFVA
jgi:hypothetical protein